MVVIFESVIHFPESRFCAVITFSILLKYVWPKQKDRPQYHISTLFKYITPFLFGTVGASMVFSDIKSGIIGFFSF